MVTVNILGGKEYKKAMEALAADDQVKIYRGAMMDSMKPVEQEMQASAPVSDEPRTVTLQSGEKVEIRPGFMKSRIKKRSRVNRKGTANRNFRDGGVLRVRVGVFRVPYVAYVEYGAPGNNVAAQPFIERSLVARENEVVRSFIPRAKVRYERHVKRAAKKARSVRR